MFVLGVSLRGKENQDAVYPRVGPIFGYFEIASLVALLITGILMIMNNGLIDILFDMRINDNIALNALREKLIVVTLMTFITIVHTIIAFRTNGKERTQVEKILSRGSSLGIFILNFVVLHYAIIIRDVL
jgi:cytochrome b subunit of formate dehydrogenase